MTDRHLLSTHTFKLNALKATLHSIRADASGRWCGGAGLEENSNEGLIEPNGSDWLVTDCISLPSGGVRVTADLRFSNQAAKATGQDPPMV